jgi:outer membrane lipoprotein-sorting protein
MTQGSHTPPPSRGPGGQHAPRRVQGSALAAGGFLGPRFRHILLLLAILLLPLPALAGEAAPLPAAEREAVLGKIEAAQRDIATIRIAMTEERRFKALSAPLRYQGEIYFDRSSRMVFLHYTSPVDSVMRLTDGTVLVWVTGSPTADVMEMGQAQGVAARPDIFSITMKDFRGNVFDDGDSYRLEDASQGGGGKSVSVVVDKATNIARRVVIRDAGGDETKLVFTDVAVNQPLPPEVAHFALPPGTRQNKVAGQ